MRRTNQSLLKKNTLSRIKIYNFLDVQRDLQAYFVMLRINQCFIDSKNFIAL